MDSIAIPFESGELEGIFHDVEKGQIEHPIDGNGKKRIKRGAIITHPHPEYGGDMDNSVVMALESAYRDHGYATLRFNFRGTGQSRGHYDTFFDLCDDVAAAYGFMVDQGIHEIALAGYSFGSWVNAHVEPKALSAANTLEKRGDRSPQRALIHHLMVSPPVTFMDFGDVSGFSWDTFVVYGDRDGFAERNALENHLKRWQITGGKCIQGCDHFYSGKIDSLYDVLNQFVAIKKPV